LRSSLIEDFKAANRYLKELVISSMHQAQIRGLSDV